ncbi:MAG: hypothetical protein KGH75_06060 [Rhodospirillales bacterium]|nr:hypothetical protein [Rhodospirillales bacterium]
MSNIVPFQQQQALAEAFVKSGLFGVKTADQALALMALCEAEGMHPAKAIQEFHIVQGRPAMKADAMLARFQKAGGSVRWDQYTDTAVTGVFSHPQGGSVAVAWTIEQAKRIGLAGKDNWKNYPRAMLRSRCISEGVRTVYPGIATGVYTVEEMQDMTPAQMVQLAPLPAAADAPPELVEKAKRAAYAGAEEYATFWGMIRKDERKALAARHEDLKAIANMPDDARAELMAADTELNHADA